MERAFLLMSAWFSIPSYRFLYWLYSFGKSWPVVPATFIFKNITRSSVPLGRTYPVVQFPVPTVGNGVLNYNVCISFLVYLDPFLNSIEYYPWEVIQKNTQHVFNNFWIITYLNFKEIFWKIKNLNTFTVNFPTFTH